MRTIDLHLGENLHLAGWRLERRFEQLSGFEASGTRDRCVCGTESPDEPRKAQSQEGDARWIQRYLKTFGKLQDLGGTLR